MHRINTARPTLLIVFALFCLSPDASPAAEPASPTRLRVMSYNIHHGQGTDGKLDLPRIAEIIAAQRADIVALQEVDHTVKRSGGVDQAQQLAALLKMQHVFGKNIDLQGGGYGNAILSRFEIVSSRNRHYQTSLNNEQRGLLEAVVTVGNRRLVVLNTHLDYHADATERLACVAELAPVVAAADGRPIVLCGDFNDVPDSKTYQAVETLFKDAWKQAGEGPGYTIPNLKPRKRIDYAWTRGVKPLRAWVVESVASDHCGLVVELELP